MGADYADYTTLQGPQAPTAQNPTLIPQFDPVTASGDGAQFTSPANFLLTYPRQPAVSVITFTGSATAGETAYIDFFNPILLADFVQVATLVVSGDTTATIAQRLLLLINTNPQLAAFGVVATYSVVSTNPTLTINWPGPVGNLTYIGGWSYVTSATATVGGSVTATDVTSLVFTSTNLPTTSLQLTLGGTCTTGDIISLKFDNPSLPNGTTTVNYTVLGGATLATVATALAVAVNADTNLDLIAMTSNATDARLYLTWGSAFSTTYLTPTVAHAATETITFATVTPSQPSALVPTAQGSETITVGGTATTGDVVKITIAASAVSPPVTVSYTVQGGDTTTLIAVGLKTAINANAILASAGFAATNVAAVVTVTWTTFKAGAVGFSSTLIGVTTETFSLGTSSPITISYVSVGGNTTTTIATALKNAVNANVILGPLGILATSSGAVVTLKWAELKSSALVPTGTVSAGATETITISALYGGQTITVGGTATATDVLHAKFTSPELGASNPVSVTFPVTAGLTTTQMATGLTAAINASPALQKARITGLSSSAVVSVSAGEQQPVITIWATGPAATLTLTGTMTATDKINVNFTGGGVPSSFQNVQYAVVGGDTTLTILATHVRDAINADAELLAAGFVATSALGVVSVTWPATLGVVAVTGNTNGPRTATITGVPNAGEIPVITFTDAALPGGTKAVPYTVQGGDTNNLIAAGFNTLINADVDLIAAGITSTVSTNVVTIVSASVYATTVARTNSAGTTVTLGGGPTETNTAGGNATETLTLAANNFGTEVLTATAFSGGSGPILPQANFVFSYANPSVDANLGQVEWYWAGTPVNVDYLTVAAMVAQGQPII